MEWYETDTFDREDGMPEQLVSAPSGPLGWAAVSVYADGKTTQGWGRDFMANYLNGAFRSSGRRARFESQHKPFAFVMRSAGVVCIDIDSHADGPDGMASAKKLKLPPTLAETSKSGGGRHLFYLTPMDVWDDADGFGMFDDVIGLESGVDIRWVGCVYHYDTQRWNHRGLATVPGNIIDALTARRESKQAAAAQRAQAAANPQGEDTIIIHDQLLNELAQPIPSGRRNNTLFAIGGKLREAGVPDWDRKISERGDEIGLDSGEIDKIIANIERYTA